MKLTAAIAKVQQHPSTNTSYFRYWLGIPLLFIFIFVWRGPIVNALRGENPVSLEKPAAESPSESYVYYDSLEAPPAPPGQEVSSLKTMLGLIDEIIEMAGQVVKLIDKIASSLVLLAWFIARRKKKDDNVV